MRCSNLSIMGLDGLDEDRLLRLNLCAAMRLGLRTSLWKKKDQLSHSLIGYKAVTDVSFTADRPDRWQQCLTRHSQLQLQQFSQASTKWS